MLSTAKKKAHGAIMKAKINFITTREMGFYEKYRMELKH
jgi:hypothetical protein